MLYQEDRHEPLGATVWDESQAHEALRAIVDETERDFSPQKFWPTHPRDHDGAGPDFLFYSGASGVIWALHYLQSRGAVTLARDYSGHPPALLEPNRAEMGEKGQDPFGSYLMGNTSIRLLAHWLNPMDVEHLTELERLIRSTMHHPTRELMWGSPGTLLAAWFLYERHGEQRWADLFRETAAVLWSQLEWSEAEGCHYWIQDMYRQQFSFLDAGHGFVGTAMPLIHGQRLLDPADWARWQQCIARTVRCNAERDGALVNWRVRLSEERGKPMRMQYCHGSPGFVVCLGDFPDDSLDDLLEGGAEATWAAGPLRKGANLCHGTGGNGYAFLKMYRRTGDPKWLDRARAFAMHGIAQVEAERVAQGRLHHSLWSGDQGFAIYLWDCIRGTDRFPSIDTFFGSQLS